MVTLRNRQFDMLITGKLTIFGKSEKLIDKRHLTNMEVTVIFRCCLRVMRARLLLASLTARTTRTLKMTIMRLGMIPMNIKLVTKM